MKQMLYAVAAWILLAAVAPLSAWSAEDVDGARDPLGISRYPYSWIVDYERDDRLMPRDYALGRVDRTRREVRVENEVRAPATREWATYETPAGTEAGEVFDHYLEQIGGETLFTCQGRDCGRSNLWANEIFKSAILYGPDQNQYYYAGDHDGHLIALYVIQRGNKRVYAHLEVFTPERQVALHPNDQLFTRLAGEGSAVVEGLVPGRTGVLTDPQLDVLHELIDGLGVFRGQTIYVVCHLYGSEPAEALIERSEACAGQAVDALAADNGPALIPFGAGPLLPRIGMASRLELVLPHRLSHAH
jgi:hypothetical protein